MSEEKKYPENVRLTRLYEKQSKTGQTYFTGRLGDSRVAVLKSKDTADDGTPMWDVLLSKAPPKQDRPQGENFTKTLQDGGPPAKAAQRNREIDDEIPF